MKVKLNISRLSIAEKLAKGRQIVASITDNADFPHPTPELAVVTAALNDLETAAAATQAARQEAKTKTSIQNEKELAVDGLLGQLAAYVESVAGSNEALVRSAGMDTKGVPFTLNDVPAPPANFSATAGDRDGEIDLSWEATRSAKSYVVERSLDAGAAEPNWSHVGVSTRSRLTAAGLASGSRYWFRVAAINGFGQSGWSDPAMKIAP
jgi:hypothetical protein